MFRIKSLWEKSIFLHNVLFHVWSQDINGCPQCLRLSPNMTGWCDAIESFLQSRNYKLQTRDTLRKRFSNALHWYSMLVYTSRNMVEQLIDDARIEIRGSDDANHLTRPNEYLQRQCPLCFGGVQSHRDDFK
ncbi:hypothetical protein BJ138DRAFT_1019499 [Hygrophoropsis aurantiaca]|uniref:Uncharacterized protein n=1 Tax=Hygrophoropsis aurantiaca TaxID=72124 RepID=A0ACB7ZTK3_9AGAM|nr:hypothetical protein BJ138DRAFT_1019499 [Hygrophoropsis aurantiaca]